MYTIWVCFRNSFVTYVFIHLFITDELNNELDELNNKSDELNKKSLPVCMYHNLVHTLNLHTFNLRTVLDLIMTSITRIGFFIT